LEAVRIEFEPLIDAAARDFITNGLDYYSMAISGCPDWCPVNFVLRGARGEVLGGLLGQLWGGWLHVTYLWIGKAARGQGHGTQMMREAEAYASAKGAIGATLETYSFQARPFYERLGYRVIGTIDDYPPGHAKFFLRKALR
jgi:ribosomal protein S18 acetylase RimI-like enzyme